MYRHISAVVLAAVVLSTAFGCGGGAGAPPEPVYQVSGKITFDGQPVVGADVVFINAEKNRSAFGRTNDAGEYRLTTFSSNDGAVEGKSVVTVSKYVAAVPEEPDPDIESEDYEPPGFGGAEEEVAPPKSEIPDKYASEQTSGLVAMVSAGSENKIDLDLTP
ncbi:MAG: carboxypeptidase regulatory-like domain-containing protein [Planctomycetaceae bacterium]|nr:carboxypeptidase regulatory-like domain-containing protein [Planctomycetaceae bacterium]